jgi:hypothetical protein
VLRKAVGHCIVHLQSLALTNPHWSRVVGYGPFSLCVIHKEGLGHSSGEINRLMTLIGWYRMVRIFLSHTTEIKWVLAKHKSSLSVTAGNSPVWFIISPWLFQKPNRDYFEQVWTVNYYREYCLPPFHWSGCLVRTCEIERLLQYRHYTWRCCLDVFVLNWSGWQCLFSFMFISTVFNTHLFSTVLILLTLSHFIMSFCYFFYWTFIRVYIN